VDQYCSAEEISDIISSVDVLASSRFHAIIFGFLHSKPVMAISWSHKYKELFKLFDLEEFVMESNEMDQNIAISLLKKLVDERKEVRAKIESKLPYLKAKVKDIFNETGLKQGQ
jgi:colanic acid/amylovoran biosynthesis protein